MTPRPSKTEYQCHQDSQQPTVSQVLRVSVSASARCACAREETAVEVAKRPKDGYHEMLQTSVSFPWHYHPH